MYELFCSSQSEIVRHSQSRGLKAFRFGLQQGDLSLSIHRKRLFTHLVYEKPENLWITPECKPWCEWTSLNMNKSLEAHERSLEYQKANMWQIAA